MKHINEQENRDQHYGSITPCPDYTHDKLLDWTNVSVTDSHNHFNAVDEDGSLYSNGKLNVGYVIHDGKLYKDSKFNVGYHVYGGVLYKDHEVDDSVMDTYYLKKN